MEAISFSREMGLTHEEFFRNLPAAIAHRAFQRDGDKVRIADDGREVVIELCAQQHRRIALLNLPYTVVRFSFRGFDEAAMGEFMQRFDLYFRRGGG